MSSEGIGFVYLKADLINPDYVNLLRRYLIRGEIESGTEEFVDRRRLIMRKTSTQEILSNEGEVTRLIIQVCNVNSEN